MSGFYLLSVAVEEMPAGGKVKGSFFFKRRLPGIAEILVFVGEKSVYVEIQFHIYLRPAIYAFIPSSIPETVASW